MVGPAGRLTFGPQAVNPANVTINESLSLEGILDALSNTGGTNTWAGPMQLVDLPVWQATATTPFTISSVVSGTAAQR